MCRVESWAGDGCKGNTEEEQSLGVAQRETIHFLLPFIAARRPSPDVVDVPSERIKNKTECQRSNSIPYSDDLRSILRAQSAKGSMRVK